MIAVGIIAILVGFVTLGWYAFFYTPPSCTDGIQNQDERGVDCEGMCANLCSTPRVDALWTRALKVTDGVYHGVSLIKNPLPLSTGAGLTYTLSLYDEGNILVAERRGTFDLDPGETRVIFEPNIVTGSRVPVRAFMKIDGGQWERAEVAKTPIRVIPGTVDQAALTLGATLENTTAVAVNNIIADALLYDQDGIVVAASETRVPVIPGRARQDVTFTWATSFTKMVTTSDIIVRIQHAAP